jgi:hypothetical protein
VNVDFAGASFSEHAEAMFEVLSVLLASSNSSPKDVEGVTSAPSTVDIAGDPAVAEEAMVGVGTSEPRIEMFDISSNVEYATDEFVWRGEPVK